MIIFLTSISKLGSLNLKKINFAFCFHITAERYLKDSECCNLSLGACFYIERTAFTSKLLQIFSVIVILQTQFHFLPFSQWISCNVVINLFTTPLWKWIFDWHFRILLCWPLLTFDHLIYSSSISFWPWVRVVLLNPWFYLLTFCLFIKFKISFHLNTPPFGNWEVRWSVAVLYDIENWLFQIRWAFQVSN